MPAAAAASSSSSSGDFLGVGVEPIRQQREPEIALPIREVVHLQPTDQGFDVVVIGEQHRNDDQRAQLGWHPVFEVQSRQRFRAEHPGDHQVDEGNREVGGRDDREQCDDDDLAGDGAPVPREHERHGEDEGREDHKCPRYPVAGYRT